MSASIICEVGDLQINVILFIMKINIVISRFFGVNIHPNELVVHM